MIILLLLSMCLFVNTQAIFEFREIKKSGALSAEFLKSIAQICKAKVFVETGTFVGETAAIAAHIFNEVHTIELSSHLYEKACTRFQRQPHVHLYCGDSAVVLPQVLNKLQHKAVIWLDGHWSCGNTARGPVNCPLLFELAAIKESGIVDAVLLIDDIRDFQEPLRSTHGTPYEGYPQLPDIIQAIRAINPSYRCWVFGDILVATSDDVFKVSPVIRAMTTSRCNHATPAELQQAENVIMHAAGAEKQAIKELEDRFGHDVAFGFNRFYSFWYGLTLLTKDPTAARVYLKKAARTGCDRAAVYVG